MQNLAPGRPGLIRPQVGQAFGSFDFVPPSTGVDDKVVGGVGGRGVATGAGGFGAVGGFAPTPA